MQISFENVSYWHARGNPFEHRALNRISLDIPPGQFVAVMGSAGSGKTTFAQMVNGLVFPHQGEVKVGSYRIIRKQKDLHFLRSDVGYVFQYPEHQVVGENVFEDISYGLQRFHHEEKHLSSLVRQMMEFGGVSYEEIKNRSPFRLSRGQMRRVALAGALITNPKILILDEPTVALDPKGRIDLLSLIKRLHEQERITIIYITHRLEEALEYAERIVVLEQGKVSADMKPCGVLARLQDLCRAGIVMTPQLHFMREANKILPIRIPDHVMKEQQLIDHIINLFQKSWEE